MATSKRIPNKTYRETVAMHPIIMEAKKWLRDAIKQLNRGDRVDALDSIHLAMEQIRKTYPQETMRRQPKS